MKEYIRNIKETTFGTFLLGGCSISQDILNHNGLYFWDGFLKSIFDKYINKSSIVIEAGANIGFHTVYLSRIAQQVYAFEPQRMIFNQLCGNLFLNNCSNVTAFNVALYNKSCNLKPAKAIEYREPNESAQLEFFESKYTCADNALAIALDSLQLTKLDFMEIDCQGSDYYVVLGAKETIERCRPIITFEIESDEMLEKHGWKKADMFQFLASLNYRFEFIDETLNKMLKPGNFIALPNELR